MTDKRTARAVGALFLGTMILGMIDAYTVAPLLQSGVGAFHAHAVRLHVGAFSVLFMALGVVGIALLLFPVLERHSRLIALTYLSARIMECLLLVVGAIVYFLLLRVSHEFLEAGSPDSSWFQSIATVAVTARFGAYQVAMIILGIASLLLCALLYRTRLIPRLISAVGFAGYALVLASGILDLLGVIDTTGAGGILYVPGALFELFLLPIWLIARGFHSPDTVG